MPRTIEFYRQECLVVMRTLRSGGRHDLPWMIDESDVRWLLDDLKERDITVSTRKGYMAALKRWTAFYGNDAPSKMQIRWPRDARPNADWLSTENAIALLKYPKTPSQDMVIHCELCLGMRRIEVIRLRVSDFDGSTVSILGKGSQGGKPRRMPYHRDTERILNRYLEYRASLIADAKDIDRNATVPDDLLIHRKGSELKPYHPRGTGIDRMMEPLKAQMGFSWGNHTLRRTFGRTMYRSGVAVPTIAKMLGHDSIEMTLRYIGVDMDDMSSAMGAFILRRRRRLIWMHKKVNWLVFRASQ